VKRKNRPSQQDYTYYMTHNVSVTTSGNYSTKALKYCIDVLGEERCMYSIGTSCELLMVRLIQMLTTVDYPYDTIEEAQDWWKTLELPGKQKDAIGRANAIKLFKLPLEL
jgi:2,3-dihydroxybenzoate decarboxylase